IVAYTYGGDANLDGKLNGDDYFYLDQGFGSQTTVTPLHGWHNGDFDYNGLINGDDYFILDANINRAGTVIPMNPTGGGGGGIAGVTAVPEPASLGLPALSGA